MRDPFMVLGAIILVVGALTVIALFGTFGMALYDWVLR